ncbi:hypothetical protein PG985_009838 [Apiospora marii]|uniref:uncharacterized protein n=1 Tax=Apiospora marii TaxID=335849 RepID=UPI00312D8B9F
MDASPTKRRALATLDVNANSPNKHARLNAAKATGQLNVYKGGSPSPSSKRALSLAEEGDENANPLQPAKRACLSAATSTAPSTAPSSPTPRRAVAAPAVTPATATTAASRSEDTEETEEEDVAITATPEQERQRSHSPETSAVFDNSQLDNSQLTTITEPDHPSPQQQQEQHQQQQQTQEQSPVAAAVTASAPSSSQLSPSAQQQQQPPQQQRSRALSSLTREEARQKAEILRLRLGLARYKVRTGQTDVPLERLQRRPVQPAHTSATTTRTTTQSSPAAPQSHSQQRRSQQQQPSSAATAFSSPISTATTTRQPLPAAPRRLSREDGSSGSERQQNTTPRKALPSGRSTSQTPRQGGDYTPSASQESATSQSRPRYGTVAMTPDREALQRLAASAALDASRRIEEAAEGGRWGSGS